MSNLLSFFLFRALFKVQTLLTNMAANLNGEIESRQERLLLLNENTFENSLFFVSTVTSLALF